MMIGSVTTLGRAVALNHAAIDSDDQESAAGVSMGCPRAFQARSRAAEFAPCLGSSGSLLDC